MITFAPHKIPYNYAFGPNSLTVTVLDIKQRQISKIQNGSTPTTAACTKTFVRYKNFLRHLSLDSISISDSFRDEEIFFQKKIRNLIR